MQGKADRLGCAFEIESEYEQSNHRLLGLYVEKRSACEAWFGGENIRVAVRARGMIVIIKKNGEGRRSTLDTWGGERRN